MVKFAITESEGDDEKSRKSKGSERSRNSKIFTRNRRGTIDSRHNEENLGEEFEETPWVPPSIGKALEFREQAILRSGNAPLRTIKVCQAAELGPGVSLYFQFVKSMALCCFFMSLFACPAIIFASFGSAVPDEDKDSFGFWKYTIGK